MSDINEDMLGVGKKRALEDPLVDETRLTFRQADAHKLPYEDESFDYYTIAFGIRNCTDINKVLDEAYRKCFYQSLKKTFTFCLIIKYLYIEF